MSRGKELLHAAVEYLADRQVSRARQVTRVAMAYVALFLLILGAGDVLNELATFITWIVYGPLYQWRSGGMPSA